MHLARHWAASDLFSAPHGLIMLDPAHRAERFFPDLRFRRPKAKATVPTYAFPRIVALTVAPKSASRIVGFVGLSAVSAP